ncbi:class I adenylate-forming enzyme family protein [Embleya hyalina]|uniref:AMP-dependent synthetase n=1 Tax=Embleya hyalina TaxID=516124 RepID=A0A401YU65_9ACTN|nr:AMP-binding protein [Embleya hyalina]GCD98150.1 AMP-dependent synthetase [Embleya hyalina]
MLLHEILVAAAREVPDRTALIVPGHPFRTTRPGAVADPSPGPADPATTSWTFAELAARSRALATTVAKRTSPGARVGILAHNRAEYVAAYYGVPWAGRVLVPLNPRLHPREWADQLARSGAELLLGDADLLGTLAWPGGPSLELGAAVTGEHTDAGWSAADPGADTAFDPATDESALTWLLFTSGTTGPPKGVRLTHRSLTAAMRASLACRPVDPDTVVLTPFPLAHVAGYQVSAHHLARRPVVVLRRYLPAELASVVREFGVTSLSLAPTMIDALLDHVREGDGLRERVRSISYGASPITPELIRRVDGLLGCGLGQGYGMTELSGNAVFLNAADHRDAATDRPHLYSAAGRPGPGVEIRIVDDAGQPLPTGAAGEISVRSEQVADGYWQVDTGEFAAGWFRTGDLGRLDAEGYLYVLDRKKDVIITGGENVSAREVEAVLREHPGVREVAVVGEPDTRWGERVVAVVVPTAGHTLDPDELVTLCRAHLAGFKVPRRVVFTDALPVTGTGKISKPALRERVVEWSRADTRAERTHS